MAAAIGPGDWVECCKGPDYPPVTVGSIWLCVGIEAEAWGFCTDVNGRTSRCKGIPILLKGGGAPWCSCGFRPIYRPSESRFLERLMDTPAPAREPVDA